MQRAMLLFSGSYSPLSHYPKIGKLACANVMAWVGVLDDLFSPAFTILSTAYLRRLLSVHALHSYSRA